jgi:hypothetical protein
MSDFSKLTEDLKSKFKPFKEVIDQYPNAFDIVYTKEKGYQMSINLDLVESFWETQDLNHDK